MLMVKWTQRSIDQDNPEVNHICIQIYGNLIHTFGDWSPELFYLTLLSLIAPEYSILTYGSCKRFHIPQGTISNHTFKAHFPLIKLNPYYLLVALKGSVFKSHCVIWFAFWDSHKCCWSHPCSACWTLKKKREQEIARTSSAGFTWWDAAHN